MSKLNEKVSELLYGKIFFLSKEVYEIIMDNSLSPEFELSPDFEIEISDAQKVADALGITTDLNDMYEDGNSDSDIFDYVEECIYDYDKLLPGIF